MKKLLSTYKIRYFVRVAGLKKNRVLAISIDFSLSDFHHNFTKNRQKNVEKTVEKQKGTFFDVKTLQVRVFFAPGSLLEVSGSDLGTSPGLRGGSFGCHSRPLGTPGGRDR